MRDYFLWLFKFITVLVVIFMAVPVMLFMLSAVGTQLANKRELPGVSSSHHQVAVVELVGVIETADTVVRELYKWAEDDDIRGIVLRVNSPGGAVGPAQEIYRAVEKLKKLKPIVASMGTVAASGGLYAALSASRIYCQPGTMTGSIGVIAQIPNFKELADKVGVEFVTIKSGKFKDVPNTFRALNEEERKFMQSRVDLVEQVFIQAVADGRNLELAAVREFADGRVLLGSEALELGLVDGFGDIYDAAAAVFEERGEPLEPGVLPVLVRTDERFGRLMKLFNTLLDFPLKLLQDPFQQRIEFKYLMP